MKSACVGVLSIIELKNARRNIEKSVSMYCNKISDRMPEDGAPIAKPSFRITVLSLLIKQFCFVIVTYHVNSSYFVLEFVRLNFMILLKTCLFSVMRMFEYMLDLKERCKFFT